MIIFLLKKSFFDVWDNLFRIVALNFGFIICLIITFLPAVLLKETALLTIISLIPGIILIHIYMGSLSYIFDGLSNFKTVSFSMMKKGFLATIKVSLIIGAMNSVFLLAVFIGLPFYLSIKSVFGLAGAAILFWVAIFIVMSMQYFFPVYLKMNGSLGSVLKKIFLITLDNPFYSFFILLWSIFLFVVSIIFAFIAPGIGSILMLHYNALKLRLYKYDWLEENPHSPRKNIPWKQLFEDDIEKLGHRSIKGMIFPWRD